MTQFRQWLVSSHVAINWGQLFRNPPLYRWFSASAAVVPNLRQSLRTSPHDPSLSTDKITSKCRPCDAALSRQSRTCKVVQQSRKSFAQSNCRDVYYLWLRFSALTMTVRNSDCSSSLSDHKVTHTQLLCHLFWTILRPSSQSRRSSSGDTQSALRRWPRPDWPVYALIWQSADTRSGRGDGDGSVGQSPSATSDRWRFLLCYRR